VRSQGDKKAGGGRRVGGGGGAGVGASEITSERECEVVCGWLAYMCGCAVSDAVSGVAVVLVQGGPCWSEVNSPQHTQGPTQSQPRGEGRDGMLVGA
jgi:hypothetical protein